MQEGTRREALTDLTGAPEGKGRYNLRNKGRAVFRLKGTNQQTEAAQVWTQRWSTPRHSREMNTSDDTITFMAKNQETNKQRYKCKVLNFSIVNKPLHMIKS